MRRPLVAAAVAALFVPLLVACGPHPPSAVAPGSRRIDVASPDLVSFKSHTGIPNCPRVSSTGVATGMPGVTLPCLGGGRRVDVAGLRGPMIVNFWASWCGDCVKEMPALAAYAKGQSKVLVLGIDYLDTQPGAALQLAQHSKVAYPLVADTTGALDTAGALPHITGLPYTAFIDSEGRIVHIEAGVMKTEADVAAAAHQYLGASG
jgi:thiol-disulfide isomerase/thioredoxin